MKIIVKKLQGAECTLEMDPTTCISGVKRLVAEQLNIPVKEQKLLFLGRTLVDERTLQSYPTIKDGSKLNLVVKKPDGLYEVAYKAFKKVGMTESESKTSAEKFVSSIQENFNKLSWDDIERLASDCLEEETHKQHQTETEQNV